MGSGGICLSMRYCASGWVVWKTSPLSCEGWFWHLCHECVYVIVFLVNIVPATLRWFFRCRLHPEVPEDVSLDFVGIMSGFLTEEDYAIADAGIKLDTLTSAFFNFKSVCPAVCVAT